MIDYGAAIDSVKKSSKSELSSRFLSRLKFENSLATFGRIQPIVPGFIALYPPLLHKSLEDRPNSPKSGVWNFEFSVLLSGVLIGTQEMSCLQHRRCPLSNTGDVLFRTQEMSCLEHRRCPAWNTRDVLLGTHAMSCVEHRRCPAWNIGDVLPGTQEILWLEEKITLPKHSRKCDFVA